MFSGIRRLIFALLVIIIYGHSPAHALQPIQLGEYSITYTGGRFDKSNMKGNITGVTFYHRQIKLASAESVYIDHNFKEGIKEGQLTLSFEELSLRVKEETPQSTEFKMDIDAGNVESSIKFND